MNSTEKLELQVAEEQDGSAIVQMQKPEDNPQHEPEVKEDDVVEPEAKAEGGTVDDLPADDSDIDGDDPDREAIRAARREERKLKKQLHREKARESSYLINALKKQNSELAERLSVLEKRTSGAELARIDKAIDDAATRVEYAKMKLQEAVETNKGADVIQAQQLWYDNQRELESLQAIKNNASKQLSQNRSNVQVPDVMVQRNAADWMQKNTWYDPQMKDPDSRIAQTIDQALTEEGFDPALPDYWDELDERLQKYLPHRYKMDYSNNNNAKVQRPKSVVTSSGRETTGAVKPNEYRLTPDRVAAIKEAGMWDNPEARAKMAKKFAEWDKLNKTRS